MSQTLEDHQPSLIKRREEAQVKLTGQLRRMQVEAERMSELSTDPKWELYGRYVEQTKRENEAALAILKPTLTGNVFLDGKEYGQIKLDERYHEGWRDALTYALGVAKEIIERGTVAGVELKDE